MAFLQTRDGGPPSPHPPPQNKISPELLSPLFSSPSLQQPHAPQTEHAQQVGHAHRGSNRVNEPQSHLYSPPGLGQLHAAQQSEQGEHAQQVGRTRESAIRVNELLPTPLPPKKAAPFESPLRSTAAEGEEETAGGSGANRQGRREPLLNIRLPDPPPPPPSRWVFVRLLCFLRGCEERWSRSRRVEPVTSIQESVPDEKLCYCLCKCVGHLCAVCT